MHTHPHTAHHTAHHRAAGPHTVPRGSTEWSVGSGIVAGPYEFAFRSTEEKYRVQILGCRKRGHPSDKPLDHTTGYGRVDQFKGAYHDALFNKHSRVVPVIVEAGYGGITPHALAHFKHLSKRARGKGAKDRTRYGRLRLSLRDFFTHHTQQIAVAAAQYHAKCIRKSIISGKTAALPGAKSATAAGSA